MDEEIRQIKAQLVEERRRREDEERKREEADERARIEQVKREEEQCRREHAERVAASALSQDLATFLQGCHNLSRLVKPVNELSSATTGSTTKQTGRLYLQFILPWNDFPSQQRLIWEGLYRTDSVWTSRVYPSATNLDYLQTMIEPIGSEDELRFLERLLVEDMVKKIFEEMDKDEQLDVNLHARGRISFENQARFREAEVTAAMEGMSVSGTVTSQPRNTRADQFCVLRSKDGIARPVVAIEYKAPHKLTIKEICTGLQGEIWPERDVIDKDDDDFEFLCKNLMAAVLTQLFSYMIEKGVRYGYVCTGEVYVFMRIPANPTAVYYSVNVPRRDFEEDSDNRLERTAVSQVFAFVQQALEDDPPDQAWISSARSTLKRWKVEFIDVLRKIPETERKSRDASAYQPGRWAPSGRTSPIVLRRRCGDDATAARVEESDSDDAGEDEGMESPSGYIETRSRAMKKPETKEREGTSKRKGTKKGDSQDHAQRRKRRETSFACGPSIESRAYCTHECLRGMCQGLALDLQCPNVAAHGCKHLQPSTFLHLIRQQLAVDRGKDADCCALYTHGSRGALLKVRLKSHGYTMVAKGVETCNLRYLLNEKRVYDRLETLQGRYVPVCCGVSELDVPYYYDGAELTDLLFLSWAGLSLASMTRNESSVMQVLENCLQLSRKALMAIHEQAVLHHDVKPRNMLYDADSQTLMLVDFERSELRDRRALSELSPNRKRKRPGSRERKAEVDCFKKEASMAEFNVKKAFSFVVSPVY